ncbi:MAG: phage tail assembly protein [Silvanigrellaceae bacterium]|jgi:hypothetical protein|nr:phage tail assembly protein [Silvanigrellaceae bacterium]
MKDRGSKTVKLNFPITTKESGQIDSITIQRISLADALDIEFDKMNTPRATLDVFSRVCGVKKEELVDLDFTDYTSCMEVFKTFLKSPVLVEKQSPEL